MDRILSQLGARQSAARAQPPPAVPPLREHTDEARRASLGDSAAAQLRRAILDGTVPVGTRVGEARLAAALGVSRGPVRDAVQQLHREGLVERSATGRIYVTGISEEEVVHLYALRMALETMALRAAVPRLTTADVRHLRALIERMEELGREPEHDRALAQLDLAFHGHYVALAGQRPLAQAWDGIRELVAALMEVTDVHNPRLPVALQRHRAILDAAVRGESEAAVTALAEHLLEAREVMAARIKALQGPTNSRPAAGVDELTTALGPEP